MDYQMLIADTLFDIHSPRPIRWKQEELGFLYRGEAYRQRITVQILMADKLPGNMERQVYRTDGIRFGFDKIGNEIREYNAPHIAGNPVYAESVLSGSAITVYFVDNDSIWNNPNIHFWNWVHMERVLLRVDALVFHCSYLLYEGKAILFSAPSGTGKTTQAKLWEKLYSARIVNGDKAVIQKKDDKWYACGYPFHGSAQECFNEAYPIDTLVIVRQNPMDYIEQLRPLKKVQYVYSETTVASWDVDDVNHALNLIGQLTSEVKVICQQCTMKDEACHTLHCYLKEE